MYMKKWYLLKLLQEWEEEGDKGEWWGRWTHAWYIWCIVTTFINATMYKKIKKEIIRNRLKKQRVVSFKR
jgi:hypothetical protein